MKLRLHEITPPKCDYHATLPSLFDMSLESICYLLAVCVVLEVVVLVGEAESALVHLDDVPRGVLVVLRHHPREEAAGLKINSHFSDSSFKQLHVHAT